MPDDLNEEPYGIVDAAADVPDDLKRQFWGRIRDTLRDVFHHPQAQEVADAFRARLRKAGTETELHAYHLDPLQVAADLAGDRLAPVTPGQRAAYAALVRDRVGLADVPDAASLQRAVPDDVLPRPS
ncbi:hypothetical protein OPKNFCMD_1841 [Methylobacterium crusticola]|uniref:Uncharacterized protein n=1 Tax=Methylobacterium crusticola TaxID=1697972 RepID=A0ABQ4QUV6_9HYPH|nr:hypothetical protein [Methylobacterium crusticola]GJD49111.1 hypothetical protein OPKNFCMD_1841 [Methylobacterium crusticola]